MAERIAFKLPDIGEGVAEGEIVALHVKPGDVIHEDAPLLDVMTDKVTAEIPAPLTGRVVELLVQVGQTVRVGEILVQFETDSGLAAAPLMSQAVPAAVEIPPPEAQVTPLVIAPFSPEPPEKPEISSGSALKTAPDVKRYPMPCSFPEKPSEREYLSENLGIKAAPATRRLARSLGVTLETIIGTGPGGRITPEDVQQDADKLRAMAVKPQTQAPLPIVTAPSEKPSQDLSDASLASRWPLDTPTGLSPLRRKIATHLVAAKRQAPHFTLVEEIDMGALSALRDRLKPVAQAEGWSLSYLPLIFKALTVIVPAFPEFNATFDETSQHLTCHSAFHAGIAVDIPEGLVVPVLKNAHRLPLRQLAEGIAGLADRARTGRLQSAELQGGTLTITNIGAIGGLFGTPILNLPQVAILGLGKIQPRALVVEGEIVARPASFVSITCDHRVIDGALAARFLNALKITLESPERLVLA